jgi:hypothetical protein
LAKSFHPLAKPLLFGKTFKILGKTSPFQQNLSTPWLNLYLSIIPFYSLVKPQIFGKEITSFFIKLFFFKLNFYHLIILYILLAKPLPFKKISIFKI